MTYPVYLADGRRIRADISDVAGQTPVIEYDHHTIPVAPLAPPYDTLGYGEIVSIALASGRNWQAVLQPQEYQYHVASLDTPSSETVRAHNAGDVITDGKDSTITAVYDQTIQAWREMTDAEYERERRAWDEDAKDMEHIRQEWHEYRNEGLGSAG